MKQKRKFEILIVDWADNFTNSDSRKVKHLSWLPIPTKEGEHYCAMMCESNGAEIYGVWIALVIMASKCPVRGRLIKANGEPHDFRSISQRTRISERILKRCIEWLDNETDWVELVDWTDDAGISSAHAKKSSGNHPETPGNFPGKAGSESGCDSGESGKRPYDIEHRDIENMDRTEQALRSTGLPSKKGEGSQSDVFSRVKALKSSGGWYVETEQSLAATAAEVFGKEWQGIGGWRKRFREDSQRTRKCWSQFAADVGEGKAIKNPGGYLNDLWKRFPASKAETEGKEAE